MSQPLDSILQQLTEEVSLDQRESVKQQLVDGINYLLVHNFSGLVQILYRVDVNETRLKQLLQDHPQTDAAVLIADLLMERQEEKLKTKNSFPGSDSIPEDEKW